MTCLKVLTEGGKKGIYGVMIYTYFSLTVIQKCLNSAPHS